jgi:hypothetical protein
MRQELNNDNIIIIGTDWMQKRQGRPIQVAFHEQENGNIVGVRDLITLLPNVLVIQIHILVFWVPGIIFSLRAIPIPSVVAA